MKTVTFGELMLRLAPMGYLRFTQAKEFEARFGGAEANVAASLALFDEQACFVSAIPSHEIGQLAVNSLREIGVDVSEILRKGDRLGIFYLEKGASQRGSKVIYDRKNSAIACANENDFDWQKILDGAGWFHFTGITPALGDNVAKCVENALKECKKRNITVSCDLNYRKNLWSREKAKTVMAELMQYVDICIANEEDAFDVFGIKAENSDVLGGKVSQEDYKSVARQLKNKFGFKKVAITLRGSISANDNNWAGILYDGEKFYSSKEYSIHIVDRVGGGDSFGAGLIYALSKDYSGQDAIDFAVAASCLKQSIEGDYNRVTVNEVITLMKGNASGRVQR